MFLKIALAMAVILGTASGALAIPKQKHNTSRAYHRYDTRAEHGGSASRGKATHARVTHAKTTSAKTAHKKQNTKQTSIVYDTRNGFSPGAVITAEPEHSSKGSYAMYAMYKSRKWSFRSATNAVMTVAPKHRSSPAYVTNERRTGVFDNPTSAPLSANAKHSINTGYVSYDSANRSFANPMSALAMANPKHRAIGYELYNTRAQYTALATGAAGMPRQRHSSNPAYDVYSIRGWYIGSDPDPTIRFMLAMDPASSD